MHEVEFAKSSVRRAMRASVVYLPRCTSHHLPTCRKRANFSVLRASVPINVPNRQHVKCVPIFQLRLPESVPICQLVLNLLKIFKSLNFSIKLNICKFQEYLGNS